MANSSKQDQLRKRVTMWRLTEQEYGQIKKESTALGLSMSEYFRRLVFDKRSHLLVDAAILVKWLDAIAAESSSSNRALCRFIESSFDGESDEYCIIELGSLITNCIASQSNIEKCMKKLISLMGR
jgi:hypothetical protein